MRAKVSRFGPVGWSSMTDDVPMLFDLHND